MTTHSVRIGVTSRVSGPADVKRDADMMQMCIKSTAIVFFFRIDVPFDNVDFLVKCRNDLRLCFWIVKEAE